MKYCKDTDNEIYAFEEDVEQETIDNIAKKRNITLTQITETEYRSFQLFGVFDKTEDEIRQKEQEAELNKAKQSKINEINQACEKAIISGFTSDALGEPRLYQSEKEDQLNLIGAVSSGTDQPFKCSADGGSTWEYKLHTHEQLSKVLNDGALIKAQYLQKAGGLKEKIKNAQTIEELEKIKW